MPDLARTGGDRLSRNLFMVNPLKWSLEPTWGDDSHTANAASLDPFSGPGGAPFFFTDVLLRLLGHPVFGDGTLHRINEARGFRPRCEGGRRCARVFRAEWLVAAAQCILFSYRFPAD